MIQEFKVYQELFEKIDKKTSIKLDLYVIGGAALLYREIKPATKDIDIVVKTKEEIRELSRILYSMGFTDFFGRKGYENFEIGKQLEKKDIRVDIFLNKVCLKFYFSNKMVNRSERIMKFSNIAISLASNEDIFAFKTMTIDRNDDINDCIALAKRGLEWGIILEEIKSQIKESGEDKWICWINETLIKLDEKGVEIPILDKTDRLTQVYNEANF
jgi:hypothetical protein